MTAPTFEDALASLDDLDDDWWNARACLKHIRDGAHARQRSAPAVLGVVLARVAACIPHQLRIPPIVGSDAGLGLITAVLAPPGVGKSTASHIGGMLLPAPSSLNIADHLPIGTGEGLIEVFFGMVEEEDENQKPVKVKKQIRHNAFFYIDEGQVLSEIGTRKNATLLPTIRTVFTGGTVGQMNATEERRRLLAGGSYSIGIVVALQTLLAGPLLDDAAGGTPQRMLWLPAIDPTIPDNGPTWPGPLPWQPPSAAQLQELRGNGWIIGEEAFLEVDGSIEREIRAADLARARGEVVTSMLEAHEGLLRLKVAGLLALLEGRLRIEDEDWQLAAAIKQASNTTRAMVEEAMTHEAATREQQFSRKLARRAAHADEVVAVRRAVDCARRIAAKVWADPDKWTRMELYRAMRRQRDWFDEGLDHAVAEEWVREVDEPGQGDAKRNLVPGPRRPS